jgi:hypothetical protein
MNPFSPPVFKEPSLEELVEEAVNTHAENEGKRKDTSDSEYSVRNDDCEWFKDTVERRKRLKRMKAREVGDISDLHRLNRDALVEECKLRKVDWKAGKKDQRRLEDLRRPDLIRLLEPYLEPESAPVEPLLKKGGVFPQSQDPEVRNEGDVSTEEEEEEEEEEDDYTGVLGGLK